MNVDPSTLVTMIATVGAALLAAHCALRRRYVLAAVCALCFFAMLRPTVVYGAEVYQTTNDEVRHIPHGAACNLLQN